MQAPKLFDTMEIDLNALAEKNRKLRNENKRLKLLLKLARPSVEAWMNRYQAKFNSINGRPDNYNYVNEARELIDEIEAHRKVLDAIDRRLVGQEGGDHADV